MLLYYIGIDVSNDGGVQVFAIYHTL